MNDNIIIVIATILGPVLAAFIAPLATKLFNQSKKEKGNNKAIINKVILKELKKNQAASNIKNEHKIIVIIFSAFLAFTMGGGIWNLSNRLFGWSFYMGGSNNEPHGIFSFYWGFITTVPIPLMCLIVSFFNIHKSYFWKSLLFIVIYGIFGGLSAVLFYNLDLRGAIETFSFNYALQEVIIAVVWSIIISLITLLPILLFHKLFIEILNGRQLILQIPLAIFFTVLFVSITLLFPWTGEVRSQIRGLFAGTGLRLGLFIGILYSLIPFDNTKHKVIS